MTKGKYIVIEGPEGVGKTTQVQLIADGLRAAGLAVRIMREPDSQNDLTARAIRHLTQDPRYPMNTKTEVLLYNAARSQSLDFIAQSVDSGITCLVDRNYLTTLAVQYYGRGDVPDYEAINSIIRFAVGDMEPDLTVILDAEVATLQERLKDRYHGERFDNLDDGFLERVRAGYLWEAKQRHLPIIYATGDRETVFKEVWKLVAVAMAERTPTVAAETATAPESIAEIIAHKPPLVAPPINSATPSLESDIVELVEEIAPDEPFLTKTKHGVFNITPAGRDYLQVILTNAKDNVYAFTEEIRPVTIAAAMARLSRRGDDLRVTLLDEFTGQNGKDESLLQRVITAYGDDSVQQLIGQYVVVENASNLLTKKLEWGRLAAYLEQSTRYIYFDQKDASGNYKYHIPAELNKKTKQLYKTNIDQIFDLYSDLVHKLTDHIQQTSSTPKVERDGAWRSATRAQACDAARPLLPVATRATVGIFASGQALESLIMHLLSDDLPEARTVGEQLLAESRKVIPIFLERADKPDRGGATIAYLANTRGAMRDLAFKELPDHHAGEQDSVQLVSHWPHNELDLVADMLYEHSSLPLSELQRTVNGWSYQQKVTAFNTYMGERLNRRHRPGRALEKAHYSFDLVCDYGIFRDMQRHRMVDDLEWQQLTPRYGYVVPELVDAAGLTSTFERCFDISLELYSELLAAGYNLEAQYATLLGHRMRWKLTYNAREAFHLHELRTSPQGHPGYRKLTLQMHEKLAEVHPLMAEAMKFVNKGEDPELTRLAAERYTQFKLQNLEQDT
jgi:dTMP kinase